VYHCVPNGICDFYQGVQVRILTQAVPGSVWNVQIPKVCPVINAQQVIGHIIKVSVALDWMTGYHGDSNLSNLKGSDPTLYLRDRWSTNLALRLRS